MIDSVPLSEGRKTMFSLSNGDWLWWANEIRIWALAGAAFLGLVTFGASYAQIRLQSIVSREKDVQLEQYKRESGERVAGLEAETAKAKERAAALEKEAEEARVEQQRLKNLVVWRSLTEEQKNVLHQRLSLSPSTVTLVYNFADAEGLNYLAQFTQVFSKAGWTVRPDARAYAHFLYSGLIVPGTNAGNVRTIRDALTAAGLSYSVESLEPPPMYFAAPSIVGEATLFVGTRTSFGVRGAMPK